MDSERAFLQDKAEKLYLLESNPLKLYEDIYELIKKEHYLIDHVMERINKLDQSQEHVYQSFY